MVKKKLIVTLLIVAFTISIATSVNGSAPTIVSTSPTDGSTGVDTEPTLTAYVTSTNASVCYFMYNNSGTWSELGNTSGANWTNQKVTQSTTWDTYSKSYTYTVNVSSDNGGNWTNSSAVTFTLVTPTEHAPFIVYAILPTILAFAFINVVLQIMGKFKF